MNPEFMRVSQGQLDRVFLVIGLLRRQPRRRVGNMDTSTPSFNTRWW